MGKKIAGQNRGGRRREVQFNLKSKIIKSKIKMGIVILGIESSCDDTSAAILKDGVVLSNVIASQKVHEAYGGVVPGAIQAHQ